MAVGQYIKILLPWSPQPQAMRLCLETLIRAAQQVLLPLPSFPLPVKTLSCPPWTVCQQSGVLTSRAAVVPRQALDVRNLRPATRSNPRPRPRALGTTVVGRSPAETRLKSLQDITCFLGLLLRSRRFLCRHLLRVLSRAAAAVLKLVSGIRQPVQGLLSAAKPSGQILPSAVAPPFQAVQPEALHLHQVLLTAVVPHHQALFFVAVHPGLDLLSNTVPPHQAQFSAVVHPGPALINDAMHLHQALISAVAPHLQAVFSAVVHPGPALFPRMVPLSVISAAMPPGQVLLFDVQCLHQALILGAVPPDEALIFAVAALHLFLFAPVHPGQTLLLEVLQQIQALLLAVRPQPRALVLGDAPPGHPEGQPFATAAPPVRQLAGDLLLPLGHPYKSMRFRVAQVLLNLRLKACLPRLSGMQSECVLPHPHPLVGSFLCIGSVVRDSLPLPRPPRPLPLLLPPLDLLA